MDRATVLALDRVNREFYSARAAEFAATREAPWPGWERLLPQLAALPGRAPGRPLRILDAGCGSGRLGRWLAERLARPHLTIGIDRSLPILLAARRLPHCGRRSGANAAAIADLVASNGSLPCRDGELDAAVAIGLLHHLPSFALRRRLLEELVRGVATGGLVALAFWQFGADPRFARRIARWESAPGVDEAQLEPGDHLMRWGDAAARKRGSDVLRYCHWAEPAEVEQLTAGLSGEVIDTFHADGRSGALNLYRLLRRV